MFGWRADVECWLGSFKVLQGIQTSIAKKSYIFVIFQGGGSGPPFPPLDPHMYIVFFNRRINTSNSINPGNMPQNIPTGLCLNMSYQKFINAKHNEK